LGDGWHADWYWLDVKHVVIVHRDVPTLPGVMLFIIVVKAAAQGTGAENATAKAAV
jgi:hypothetical protein